MQYVTVTCNRTLVNEYTFQGSGFVCKYEHSYLDRWSDKQIMPMVEWRPNISFIFCVILNTLSSALKAGSRPGCNSQEWLRKELHSYCQRRNVICMIVLAQVFRPLTNESGASDHHQEDIECAPPVVKMVQDIIPKNKAAKKRWNSQGNGASRLTG